MTGGARRPERAPIEVPGQQLGPPAGGSQGTPRGGRTFLGTLGSLFLVLVCLVYISNPTLGTIELIPDMLPFGNLDEAGAGAALVFALSYLFKGKKR